MNCISRLVKHFEYDNLRRAYRFFKSEYFSSHFCFLVMLEANYWEFTLGIHLRCIVATVQNGVCWLLDVVVIILCIDATMFRFVSSLCVPFSLFCYPRKATIKNILPVLCCNENILLTIYWQSREILLSFQLSAMHTKWLDSTCIFFSTRTICTINFWLGFFIWCR